MVLVPNEILAWLKRGSNAKWLRGSCLLFISWKTVLRSSKIIFGTVSKLRTFSIQLDLFVLTLNKKGQLTKGRKTCPLKQMLRQRINN